MEQNKDLRNTHAAEYELIAKTFMGLEPVLAKELTQLGANNVQIGRRMVSFTGDKEMMYRANFQLHTAIRILKPIRHFKAKSADADYKEIKRLIGLNIWNQRKRSLSTLLCSLRSSVTLNSYHIKSKMLL